MSLPVVVFDLDGTLLDTLEDLAFAGNTVLKERGHPVHPYEKYRYFVGDGLATLIDRIVPDDADRLERKQCLDRFREIYSQCWHRQTAPYRGIESMLEELHRSGCVLSILSNKPHDFTLLCVDHFFPKKLFAKVLGQREGIPKKPHPQGALDIADELGVAPAQCFYVGDTKVDMQTGRGAGMRTIGVLWGFRERQELQENGADTIVSTPAELCRAVLADPRT